MTEEGARAARFRLLNLALQQSEKFSPSWDPAQRDCAGFVRFLYREAVTGKSKMWMDHNHSIVDFASGDDLIGYNFSPVTRVVSDANLETGDVLVFYSPNKKFVEAWHTMVVLKPMGITRPKTLLIYHNGAQGAEGKVKKVWLSELMESAASEWRPVLQNSKFLGAFRWKGWSL